MILLTKQVTQFLNSSAKRCLSSAVKNELIVMKKPYSPDEMTNITPNILALLDRQLHHIKYHPLWHLKRRLSDFFYNQWQNARGNPIFSVHDVQSPVVTPIQNFDSVLVPKDHVSRKKQDNFYINKEYMLRAHTSAHQADLVKMGLDNFLVIGDVYRRDAIDATHYPCFHQAEGVRLVSKVDLVNHSPKFSELDLFASYERTNQSQGVHHPEVLQYMSTELKSCLEDLAVAFFGKGIEYRWVDAYFPFTCPSWELEIKFENEWMEILGCGIMEQQILANNGASDKVGWAFGIGLERWAMKLYNITDIRTFWSKDPGFISQFKFEDSSNPVVYKPIGNQPALINDISFWLPDDKSYDSNDFFDLVRNIGGDLVQQVDLFDEFSHPKTAKSSHTYRIIYRSLDRPLSQKEVAHIMEEIRTTCASKLNVEIR